jgi:mesencephalic astrocyte-derived neurotrophic factor
MHCNLTLLLALLVIVQLGVVAAAKKKEKTVDPKECEVCINNLEKIDMLISKENKYSKPAIESAIGTHCTLSGFGSDWKPNPALENSKDVKMCYIFEPIKKAIAEPFSMGMPKAKVCKRLMKDNPDICELRYPIKVEKKEGESVNYSKMKIKDLKKILAQRNTKCTGCTEKSDFVKKCEETEHLEL